MSVTRMLITVSERILLIVPTLTDLIHVCVIQVTAYVSTTVISTTASTLWMKIK